LRELLDGTEILRDESNEMPSAFAFYPGRDRRVIGLAIAALRLSLRPWSIIFLHTAHQDYALLAFKLLLCTCFSGPIHDSNL
jgi:hypothetical protein